MVPYLQIENETSNKTKAFKDGSTKVERTVRVHTIKTEAEFYGPTAAILWPDCCLIFQPVGKFVNGKDFSNLVPDS